MPRQLHRPRFGGDGERDRIGHLRNTVCEGNHFLTSCEKSRETVAEVDVSFQLQQKPPRRGEEREGGREEMQNEGGFKPNGRCQWMFGLEQPGEPIECPTSRFSSRSSRFRGSGFSAK